MSFKKFLFIFTLAPLHLFSFGFATNLYVQDYKNKDYFEVTTDDSWYKAFDYAAIIGVILDLDMIQTDLKLKNKDPNYTKNSDIKNYLQHIIDHPLSHKKIWCLIPLGISLKIASILGCFSNTTQYKKNDKEFSVCVQQYMNENKDSIALSLSKFSLSMLLKAIPLTAAATYYYIKKTQDNRKKQPKQ